MNSSTPPLVTRPDRGWTTRGQHRNRGANLLVAPDMPRLARERPGSYEGGGRVGHGASNPWAGAAIACRTAARAPVDALGAEHVKAALQEVAAARRALDAASARLVRAAEDRDAHRTDGATDTTAWLRDTIGVSVRDAKAQSRLGRDLEVLPQTAAALAEGRIGTDQAATIGRAARGGRIGDAAATEARLLPDAQQPPERFARRVRAAEQEADGDLLARDERRARAQRRLSLVDRPDGLVELHGLLDRVSAEFVRTGLDAFETLDGKDVPEGQRRRPEQRRADALVELAKAALDAGDAPVKGGVRPHVSVLIDAAALGDDHGAGGETAFGGQISTGAVRRLLCDADVTRIVMCGPSELLDVGRATRSWTRAQRNGIVGRDGRCRGPSCDRPAAWCRLHHIRWWTRDQGRTSVDNGLLLCDADHDLIHSRGWTVALDPRTAEATWTSPTGRVVVTKPHRERGTGGPGRRRTA